MSLLFTLSVLPIALQHLVMQGVQQHIESPRQTLRSEGLVTGEHLMNWLLPEAKEPLHFECEDSPGTTWLKQLMRPLDEQVRQRHGNGRQGPTTHSFRQAWLSSSVCLKFHVRRER